MMDGIPEGYEFVRVGRAESGDWVVGIAGNAVCVSQRLTGYNNVIIRKKVPECRFPHGVFKDGWITEDYTKGICWWSEKPLFDMIHMQWTQNCKIFQISPAMFALRCGVSFNVNLSQPKRIQQVGPKYEAENPE